MIDAKEQAACTIAGDVNLIRAHLPGEAVAPQHAVDRERWAGQRPHLARHCHAPRDRSVGQPAEQQLEVVQLRLGPVAVVLQLLQLVLGQAVTRKGAYDENDSMYGMRPDDGPAVAGPKNNPMMPIAWAKSYELTGGKRGRAFCSTIGAATDLASDATRRLLVNAAYWCTGLEDKIPAEGTHVDLVGDYQPTKFGFHDDNYWANRKLSPADLRDKTAASP